MKFDENSATWELTKQHCQAEVNALAEELIDPSLTHDESQVKRGQILGLKALLSDGLDKLKQN